MQGRHAAGEVAVADAAEAGLLDHPGEGLLVGEAADALDQVLVGLAIARDPFADLRNGLERPGVIGGPQRDARGPAELETDEPAAGLQYPPGLPQRGADVGHIADAEGDRIGVGAGVRQRQALGVADGPADLGRRALFPARRDHLGIVVDDVDGRIVAAPALLGGPGQFGVAAGHVAGAAGHVEDHLARLRVQTGRRRVLPDAMHARAHQVVHQVVAAGDAVEDPAHEAGLLGRIDVAIAEGGAALAHGLAHRPARAGRLAGTPPGAFLRRAAEFVLMS